MTASQVAADLRAAAEVLRRDGWTWGTYHDACGYCVVGAIRMATNGRPDLGNDRTNTAGIALGRHVGQHFIAAWNDSGRTADEVIAALEAAADAAEAQA